MFSSTFNKTKLFTKIFYKNSNLDDSGIFLTVSPSRKNLKLHISVTPKVIKVVTDLNSSNVSGPDCILVMVLKNCVPEHLHILIELSNLCLKESCFPGHCKVSSVVSVLETVGERSKATTTTPLVFFFCGY